MIFVIQVIDIHGPEDWYLIGPFASHELATQHANSMKSDEKIISLRVLIVNDF